MEWHDIILRCPIDWLLMHCKHMCAVAIEHRESPSASCLCPHKKGENERILIDISDAHVSSRQRNKSIVVALTHLAAALRIETDRVHFNWPAAQNDLQAKREKKNATPKLCAKRIESSQTSWRKWSGVREERGDCRTYRTLDFDGIISSFNQMQVTQASSWNCSVWLA